jgi:hypothetical protein
MPATIKPAPHLLLLAPAGETKERVIAKVCTPIAVCEPERRSCYSSVRAGSTKLAIIVEMLVLVLFLVAAGVAIINCSAELSHLVGDDAVGHVAAKAMRVKYDGRDNTGKTVLQQRERLEQIIIPIPSIQVGGYVENPGAIFSGSERRRAWKALSPSER